MAIVIFEVQSRPGDSPEVGWSDIAGMMVKHVKVDDNGWIDFENMAIGTQLRLIDGVKMLANQLQECGREYIMSSFESHAAEAQAQSVFYTALLSDKINTNREIIDSNTFIVKASMRMEE